MVCRSKEKARKEWNLIWQMKTQEILGRKYRYTLAVGMEF